MAPAKYRCLVCQASEFRISESCWRCARCGREYRCLDRVPCLYLEDQLGRHDRKLRDQLYDGLLGRFYRYLMPFLQLPVRSSFASGWLVYALVSAGLLGLLGYVLFLTARIGQSARNLTLLDVIAALMLGAIALFLARHRYLLYLLLLAIPVKISLRGGKFQPAATFSGIHARLLAELRQRHSRLQVLDVATGTCNSLYRHGWMQLDAEYTALDLSETMLRKGKDLMTERGVPVDFVLGDAVDLPFQAETFDVVLNYGALNGCSDARRALAEMGRVAKSGGLVVVLDEQLYESASLVERLYFRRVLSSHNLQHHWPADLLPPTLARVQAHQVYPFYYLAAGYKQ